MKLSCLWNIEAVVWIKSKYTILLIAVCVVLYGCTSEEKAKTDKYYIYGEKI